MRDVSSIQRHRPLSHTSIKPVNGTYLTEEVTQMGGLCKCFLVTPQCSPLHMQIFRPAQQVFWLRRVKQVLVHLYSDTSEVYCLQYKIAQLKN